MKRIILQIVLVAAAAFLAYSIYNSIQTPIDFDKEKKARFDDAIEVLKDIRTAQAAYKEVHGKFSGSFDSLINFVKYDSLPKVLKIGMLTDSMIDAGLNEKKALAKGLIIRDTTRVSVLSDRFEEGFDIDNIRYIPHSGNQEFFLGQTVITTGSGIKVPVFEARAHYNQILVELLGEYEQYVINLNEQERKNDKYPGIKVGSLIEPNNSAGNWE